MKIKEIRIARGISQAQAASDLNLSQVVYNRYENGTREPSYIILSAIADYYGVTVDELLGRKGPAERKEKEDEDVRIIREQLRRDPAVRELFAAVRNAKPEHIRAALAVLKSFEPVEVSQIVPDDSFQDMPLSVSGVFPFSDPLLYSAQDPSAEKNFIYNSLDKVKK